MQGSGRLGGHGEMQEGRPGGPLPDPAFPRFLRKGVLGGSPVPGWVTPSYSAVSALEGDQPGIVGGEQVGLPGLDMQNIPFPC